MLISRSRALSVLPWPVLIAAWTLHWPWIVLALAAAMLTRAVARRWWLAWLRERARRAARLVNEELQRNAVFYGSESFVGRVLSATADSSFGVKLEILRLDYNKDSLLLTSASTYNARIESAHLGSLLRRRRAITMPESIAAAHHRLQLLREGSDYHFLVSQHHHAWQLLQRLDVYADQLKREISKIDSRSFKYINQDHIPDAREKLQQARDATLEQLRQVTSAAVDVGRIVEGLTVRIESVEDFGGLLLGIDDSQARFTATQGHDEPIDLAAVERDCEEIALILQSYEQLLN